MTNPRYPIIIGMDPAIKNFGYAVVRMDFDGRRFRMLKVGYVQNLLTNLEGDFESQIHAYFQEMKNLFRQYSPDLLVIERFQTRHRLTHSMGEKVNIMIGVAAISMQSKSVWLVSPGAWKKQANAAAPLSTLYNQARALVRQHCKSLGIGKARSQAAQHQVPHCTDAMCMALLYGARYLDNAAPAKILSSRADRLASHMVRVLDI